METAQYENKVLKRPADNSAELTASLLKDFPRVNRAQLEQTRDLVLKTIAMEVDPDRLNESIIRLAKLNEMLSKFDEIQVAREQADSARREYSRKQMELAGREQRMFHENCMLVTNSILDRAGIIRGQVADDAQIGNLNRIATKYYHRVFDSLSFDDCRKQADEILQAAVDRRSWQLVVRVPEPPSLRKGRVLAGTGEFV